MARGLAILVIALTTSSCYYLQAAHGQLSLMMARQPIDELLADPDLSPEMRRGLERVALARDFATSELGLPDNGSYRHLVELEGQRVAWNVYASPEFELRPKQWCMVIAGCMSYRTYFSHAAAERYGERLTEQGWDVYLSPVAAYSTMGRFRDPVLDSMFDWPEPEVAGLIFHELAHQQLSIRDDTAFTESFATAMQEIGLQRWLRVHPLPEAAMTAYRGRERRETEFQGLLLESRTELEVLYASGADPSDLRADKAAAFERLRERYRELRDGEWQGYDGYDRWFAQPMNNARLLPVITYHSWSGALIALYLESDEDLPRFYAAASELAQLEMAARVQRLEILEQGRTDLGD